MLDQGQELGQVGCKVGACDRIDLLLFQLGTSGKDGIVDDDDPESFMMLMAVLKASMK